VKPVVAAEEVGAGGTGAANGLEGTRNDDAIRAAQPISPRAIGADIVAFNEVVSAAAGLSVYVDVSATAIVSRNNVPGSHRGAADGVVIAVDRDAGAVAHIRQAGDIGAYQVANHYVVIC